MPSPPQAAPSHLESVLQDLGAQVRLGGGPDMPLRPRPTGLDAVDRMLGGGFPQGRLSEIAGEAGRGCTSLALALLAHTTASGAWAAMLDPADAFDPLSADAAGVDLARVLWARPRGLEEALRCAEHVLTAHGFALLVLDLAPGTSQQAPRVPDAAWPRLRRSAAGTDTALVVLGQQRLAGSCADVAVELESTRTHFLPRPDWLAGRDTRLSLVRNRMGPADLHAHVGWRMPGALESPLHEATPQAFQHSARAQALGRPRPERAA